jgi:nitrite reductase/ring-hydroxylating ferredoxin subunit
MDVEDATAVADVEEIPDRGTYLFTVREPSGREEEVILVRLDDGVAAWKNFCMHEPDQRLDTGRTGGAAMRDGEIICPRHGSMFDAATGDCDNGEAAGQTLVEVAVTVEDGTVYLPGETTYLHGGGIDDDGDMPSSTSHLSF